MGETDATNSNELGRRVMFPKATPDYNQMPAATAPLITPPVDLTDDLELDESIVDVVLTQMKEQTTLQNLLHERFVQKERVLPLEHKNGRRLGVILPPDLQTSMSFVEEAKRSNWIQEMLYSDVHQKGMLLHLAQEHPSINVSIANQKRSLLQCPMLSTPQTLALGRLAGINNQQMERLRSFTRTVGKADLKYQKKEIARIDTDVGIHPTNPEPVFRKHTLEWATTSGSDVKKKLPEQCSYWNTDVLLEVASEVDMIVSTIFLQKSDGSPTTSTASTTLQPTLQPLDYDAPGFATRGVVVLFGGDHGAG